MLGTLLYALLYGFINFWRLIGWWRWRVEGRENLPSRERGGMIIAMNHISWVDIPVVGSLVPFSHRLSWLGKAEIFAHPVSGWFFRTMNVIPIRRGKRDIAALDASVEALRAGAVLLIFPEGTRSRSGVLQAGRGGAVRLAMQAGVPIVPTAVIGTERGAWGTFSFRPVQLRFGSPYYVNQTSDGKIPPALMDQLTTEMMQRIAALLPEEQRGAYTMLADHGEG